MGQIITSFAVLVLMVAIVFKFVPNVDISWRASWLGAALTAVALLIGTTVLGVYLPYSNAASVSGAATAVTVTLLWIYFSAHVLLIGASFTRAYAQRVNSNRPLPHQLLRE